MHGFCRLNQNCSCAGQENMVPSAIQVTPQLPTFYKRTLWGWQGGSSSSLSFTILLSLSAHNPQSHRYIGITPGRAASQAGIASSREQCLLAREGHSSISKSASTGKYFCVGSWKHRVCQPAPMAPEHRHSSIDAALAQCSMTLALRVKAVYRAAHLGAGRQTESAEGFAWSPRL